MAQSDGRLDLVWTWTLLFLLRKERVEFFRAPAPGLLHGEHTVSCFFTTRQFMAWYNGRAEVLFRRYRRSLETTMNIKFYLFIYLFIYFECKVYFRRVVTYWRPVFCHSHPFTYPLISVRHYISLYTPWYHPFHITTLFCEHQHLILFDRASSIR